MIVLIVLGCLVATVSVAMIWLNQVVLDTDKYVATVAPLSEDPAIKDAVADAVTDELFRRSQADQLAREALPEKADFLVGPIIGATEGFVYEQVHKLLDSAEFSRVWQEANRKGHKVVTQVLLGEKGAVAAQEGRISLDLSGLFEIVKARLAEKGVTIFENVSLENTGAQLTIFEYENITSIQEAVSLLNHLAFWLPVIALALWGAAVWFSPNRMTALFRIGLGLAAGMVLLLVGVGVCRGYYLDAISSSKTIDVPAATSFFDIIIGSLKGAIRQEFAIGLVVAAIGFIFSPYPSAVTLRSAIRAFYKEAVDAGEKIDLGPTGTWITRQKSGLRIGGIVLALVILMSMDQPSLSRAFLVAMILALYLGVLEFLSRKAA